MTLIVFDEGWVTACCCSGCCIAVYDRRNNLVVRAILNWNLDDVPRLQANRLSYQRTTFKGDTQRRNCYWRNTLQSGERNASTSKGGWWPLSEPKLLRSIRRNTSVGALVEFVTTVKRMQTADTRRHSRGSLDGSSMTSKFSIWIGSYWTEVIEMTDTSIVHCDERYESYCVLQQYGLIIEWL